MDLGALEVFFSSIQVFFTPKHSFKWLSIAKVGGFKGAEAMLIVLEALTQGQPVSRLAVTSRTVFSLHNTKDTQVRKYSQCTLQAMPKTGHH